MPCTVPSTLARPKVYGFMSYPSSPTDDSGNSANTLRDKYAGDVDVESFSPNLSRTIMQREISPKYTPVAYQDIGKALGLAVLDKAGANPASRLGSRDGDGLAKVREAVVQWAESYMISATKRKAKTNAKLASRQGGHVDEDDEDEG